VPLFFDRKGATSLILTYDSLRPSSKPRDSPFLRISILHVPPEPAAPAAPASIPPFFNGVDFGDKRSNAKPEI
jgi:hypothetical protein